MLKPKTLPCGHSGCLDKVACTEGTPKCPICRKPYGRESVCLNITLDRLTRNLNVSCTNRGCQWSGKYQNAEAHWLQCQKLRIACPNEDCDYKVTREEMPAHSETCGKRKVYCPGCKMSVKKESLASHSASRCFSSKTECPLGCGVHLPR